MQELANTCFQFYFEHKECKEKEKPQKDEMIENKSLTNRSKSVDEKVKTNLVECSEISDTVSEQFNYTYLCTPIRSAKK